MKRVLNLSLVGLLLLSACGVETSNQEEKIKSQEAEIINWNDEIIYHVMQRSFYDSNGDGHGDLNGFVEKLDYLQELGVTTILFTPLYESGFYHNYFPTNYENIDQEFGTKEDYLNFVKAVHSRGMKFLMDMETQYAQSGNVWFDSSYLNPGSAYDNFIYYPDSNNAYPEQIFLASNSPLYYFKAWPGDSFHIVFLDLNNAKTIQWMRDFYAYWVDPNGDGNFDDGVDGFRIDHIMDDLDYKGLFTNMYSYFWKPIFDYCREINPNVFVLGEQSNWQHYGDEMVNKSGADAAFSFPLKFAIAGEEFDADMYGEEEKQRFGMNPDTIHKIMLETISRFGDSTYSVNFIENHDTDRWATIAAGDRGIMRKAAVLNLLMPGVPSIYYGQELGMTGRKHEWGSDENHIPVREAFPWTANADDEGNALWYKEKGNAWEVSFWQTERLKDIALSTQRTDENSLWNHYKKLTSIRMENEIFRRGDYAPINLNENVLAFKRAYEGKEAVLIVNLSSEEISVEMEGLDPEQIIYKEAAVQEEAKLKLSAHAFFISYL